MKIEINEPKVHEMAARVRAAFGKKEVSTSKSLEVLAQALGFKNWDTLSGMLKKEATPSEDAVSQEPQRVMLSKPFEIYCETFSCDEFGDSPEWAHWTIDQAFIDQMLNLQALCKEKDLDHIAVDIGSLEWQEPDKYSYNMRGDELYVSQTDFWFRAAPKHASYYCETRMIEIKDLISAATRDDFRNPYLAWADGILFKDGSSAQDFARQLLEDEVIDIEESRIDKMPGNGFQPAPEKLPCVKCGLPTQVDDYGLCNACHDAQETPGTKSE